MAVKTKLTPWMRMKRVSGRCRRWLIAQTWLPGWSFVGWVILVGLLGIGIVEVFVYGVALRVYYVPVEAGKPAWLQVPWAAFATLVAALVGGTVAFLQFNRKTLEERFADILDRLADKDSPLLRSAAVVRLSEMAEDAWPGRWPFSASPRSFPGFPSAAVRNFPFFYRAANQLASALHMEPDKAVRIEVVKAVRRMAAFGRKGDQTLLRMLISELAHSNRVALDGFTHALARFDALEQIHPVVENLYGLSAVDTAASRALRGLGLYDPWMTACTDDILRRPEFPGAVQVYLSVVSAQDIGNDPKVLAEHRALCLTELDRTAECLIQSSVALMGALSQLRKPLPSVASEVCFGLMERRTTLDLCGCFLAKADLSHAILAGVNLEGAFLHCAHLIGTDLRGAILSDARAPGAVFGFADMRNVLLSGTHLEEAALRGARLQKATIYSCQLKGADLRGVKIARGKDRTDFSGSNWWEAKLGDEEGGADEGARARVDEAAALREWLAAQFPQHDARTNPFAVLFPVPDPVRRAGPPSGGYIGALHRFYRQASEDARGRNDPERPPTSGEA